MLNTEACSDKVALAVSQSKATSYRRRLGLVSQVELHLGRVPRSVCRKID